ncbi:MAG: GNAT family N-acetyltransferase [Chitinophagaceae bacterium]|nr:GNAT family N-acetyltransferase [Chitinophagaceae bacterium]
MISFRLIPKHQLECIIPFLQLLNDKIGIDMLRERLKEMQQQTYECVGVYEGEKLIGVSGLWIMTKYYVGKHIEPDNVIIHPDYRGQGIGEQLMEWIYAYGRSQGCIASELNCYVNNSAGQKFWANQNYKIVGFHYQRKL